MIGFGIGPKLGPDLSWGEALSHYEAAKQEGMREAITPTPDPRRPGWTLTRFACVMGAREFAQSYEITGRRDVLGGRFEGMALDGAPYIRARTTITAAIDEWPAPEAVIYAAALIDEALDAQAARILIDGERSYG